MTNAIQIAANLTKLINALESGEFDQAKGALFDVDPVSQHRNYCCLGVLCALEGAAFIQEPAADDGLRTHVVLDGTRCSTTDLPPEHVTERYGISGDDEPSSIRIAAYKLAAINDDRDTTWADEVIPTLLALRNRFQNQSTSQ